MLPGLSITYSISVHPILDKLLDQFDIKVLYFPDFHVPKTKMKRIFLHTWHGEMEGDVHLWVCVDLTLVQTTIPRCGVQQVQAPCVTRVLQLWISWFNWKLPNEVSLHSKVTTIGKSLWDSICVSYYFVHSINRWHMLRTPSPSWILCTPFRASLELELDLTWTLHLWSELKTSLPELMIRGGPGCCPACCPAPCLASSGR